MSDPLLAGLAGLGSAAALEVLRHLLARAAGNSQRTLDDSTSFRQDLLARIGSLEDDCASLSKERDEWQARYYTEREARSRAEWKIEAGHGPSPPPATSTSRDPNTEKNS